MICPNCKTIIQGEPDPERAKDNFTVCIHCAMWLAFTEDLQLRILNEKDLAEIEKDKEMKSTLTAVSFHIKKTKGV